MLFRSLTAELTSARRARLLVRRRLRRWGLAELIPIAELLASELVTNAVRYGTPDAPVTLSWRAEPEARVIAVHNDGDPIAPHLLRQIFEPFERGDVAGNTWGGVGLGLYIVKQIVTSHGGTVAVRSATGEGTTFEVRLPARAAARAAER